MPDGAGPKKARAGRFLEPGSGSVGVVTARAGGTRLGSKGALIQWTLEPRLRWRFWLLWACVAGAFVLLSWFGENGFQTAIRLRQQRIAQEQENNILKQSNDRLRQEIRLIQQDPALLEWLAKERLGMIGENERLYVFP